MGAGAHYGLHGTRGAAQGRGTMRAGCRQGEAQLAWSAVHWGRCAWLVSECRIWRKGCPPHTVRVGCRQQEAVGGGGQDVGTEMLRIQTWECLGCRQWDSWDAGTTMAWVQAEGCTRMQTVGWLGFRHRDAQDAQMHGEWSPWAPGCRTGARSCPPAQPSPSFRPHCVSPPALPISSPLFFPLHVCELNHLALLD